MKIIFSCSLILGGVFLNNGYLMADTIENPSFIHLIRGEDRRGGHPRGGHHIERGHRVEGQHGVGDQRIHEGARRDFRDRRIDERVIRDYPYEPGGFEQHENVYEYEGVGAGIGVGLDSPGVGDEGEFCNNGFYDSWGNFICNDYYE